MSAVATSATGLRPPPATDRDSGRLFASSPALGDPSLERKLLRVWGDAAASGTAECLVCGDAARAGRPCGSCGSELS